MFGRLNKKRKKEITNIINQPTHFKDCKCTNTVEYYDGKLSICIQCGVQYIKTVNINKNKI